jgi:hypothetical protein
MGKDRKAAKEAARARCAALAGMVDSVVEFRDDCPCTKKNCERHSRCRECYLHHSAGRLLPFCLRSEAQLTLD